jgi:hypothetical protein
LSRARCWPKTFDRASVSITGADDIVGGTLGTKLPVGEFKMPDYRCTK